jgi:hypothetical protein
MVSCHYDKSGLHLCSEQNLSQSKQVYRSISIGPGELWSCGYHQPTALLLTAVKVLELK